MILAGAFSFPGSCLKALQAKRLVLRRLSFFGDPSSIRFGLLSTSFPATAFF